MSAEKNSHGNAGSDEVLPVFFLRKEFYYKFDSRALDHCTELVFLISSVLEDYINVKSNITTY